MAVFLCECRVDGRIVFSGKIDAGSLYDANRKARSLYGGVCDCEEFIFL